jgi:hypothetical protein
MSNKWSSIMGLQALRMQDLPHYTYDDYVQWEGRWEVISGIPYAMVPMPTIEHQDMSGEIYHYLRVLLNNCPNCRPFLPVDWQITEDTIVQPDVLVVCGNVKRLKGKKLGACPRILFSKSLPPLFLLKINNYEALLPNHNVFCNPITKYILTSKKSRHN